MRNPLRCRRRAPLVLSLLALLALPAVPAGANGTLEVGLMHDDLMGSDPAGTAKAFADLGADTIRMDVIWRYVAPAPDAADRPAAFDAANHLARGYDWSRYDRAIMEARRNGLRVHLTLTGPGPVWASEEPALGNGVWKPRPSDYADFAQAVATRYASLAERYALWNEPNQGAWLAPQSVETGGRWRPWAPHRYRELVRAAYPRVRAADADATVLVGETAPSGRDDRGTTRPLRPLAFWRAFGCVDSRYRATRSGACAGFEPATAQGIAHHPYPIVSSPTDRSSARDDAKLGDTRRLLAAIDRIQRAAGIVNEGGGRFGFWFSEMGYQTNPPDPYAGVSLGRQSTWLQESQYLMWREPRVRAWTQFLLRDQPALQARGAAKWGAWQSGLYDAEGRAKPAARSFLEPFWVSRARVRRGTKVRFWGQYKAGGAHRVRLQFRDAGSRTWRTLTSRWTNAAGYFSVTKRVTRTRSYRFLHPGGASGTRTVRVR